MPSGVPTSANAFLELQLNERLKCVEQAFECHALTFVGDLIAGVDDLIRTVVEDVRNRDKNTNRLAVIVTTNGGYIETVQRIVETLRHHYEHVSFIIPNYAFSAGTVLAMSGDDIYMDYYSRLGPIDPQVATSRGRMVPALGYLIQWERLLKKAANGTLTLAEAHLMVDGFDQAELYKYEQARELSITLLKEWLVTYKFKNWTATEARGLTVTPRMRMARAVAIARQLSNTDRWHSHGYGISMAVLRKDLKLHIDDLEDEPERSEQVRQYDGLLFDYMLKLGHQGAIHTADRYLPFMA